MVSTEQKKKLLKAKIAVALQDELGRVPKEEEINQFVSVQADQVGAILLLGRFQMFGRVFVIAVTGAQRDGDAVLQVEGGADNARFLEYGGDVEELGRGWQRIGRESIKRARGTCKGGPGGGGSSEGVEYVDP